MSSKTVSLKNNMGIKINFSRVIVISKIKHQTCQISDFQTECYMGGGGGGGAQIYNLVSDKQSILCS